MSAPIKVSRCFRYLICSDFQVPYSFSTNHNAYISSPSGRSTRKYTCSNTLSSHFMTGEHFTPTPNYSIQSQIRTYSLHTRKCWKCGDSTNSADELFFCKCGVVQSVHSISYFDLFGLEDSFDVDISYLSSKYKELQKLLHPDKYTLKSQKERELSEEQSSLVNKAYTTLNKPLNRALYMLERAGQPLEEDNTSVDQEFLLEIMEINEEIAEAKSTEELRPIELVNNKRLEDNVASLSALFKKGDITEAKKLVINLKYFTNIDDKIKDIYREQY